MIARCGAYQDEVIFQVPIAEGASHRVVAEHVGLAMDLVKESESHRP